FLLPTMHSFAASAVRGLLLSLGGLRRISIQCPQSLERRHIGLCASISEGICRMGGEPFIANEALSSQETPVCPLTAKVVGEPVLFTGECRTGKTRVFAEFATKLRLAGVLARRLG